MSFNKNRFFLILLLSILMFCIGNQAYAAKRIRFVSVYWTGVTVKTELAVEILKSLGYEASNTTVSVPILYKALEKKNADVFLGNWMPAMDSVSLEFFKRGRVIRFCKNMGGGRYTLAAPSYAVDGGLKSFKDISRFGDRLGWKIYGLEDNNEGNEIIKDMIKKDMFGLGKFELVPSSETGMISEVLSFVDSGKWILFLGWSPHYMNILIDMKYLNGSTKETFGAENGKAAVYTNIRVGFDKEFPNVSVFLDNFRFSVEMMNEIMLMLHKNKNISHKDAGLIWVKNHPEIYYKWLLGVKTIDGKSGLKAFENYLKSVTVTF